MTFSTPRRRSLDQYWQRRHENSWAAFSSQLADITTSVPMVPPVTPQQASDFTTEGRRSRSRNPFRSILRRRPGDVMMNGVPQSYPHMDSADNVAFTGLIPRTFT